MEHPNTLRREPSGPRYSARVALSCEPDHAPGPVLHALQELRSVIDDRLQIDLGGRYALFYKGLTNRYMNLEAQGMKRAAEAA